VIDCTRAHESSDGMKAALPRSPADRHAVHVKRELTKDNAMRTPRPLQMTQRLRAATAPTPRGSSSVLRLSSAATRLPSGVDIAQWIDRSARAWHAEATRPAEL
jgi:hypothetical protein